MDGSASQDMDEGQEEYLPGFPINWESEVPPPRAKGSDLGPWKSEQGGRTGMRIQDLLTR